MIMKRKPTILIAFILMIAFSMSLQAQTIYRVNNNITPDGSETHIKTTIQAAIDVAITGDIIYVEGSLDVYEEDIEIDKQLTIIGPGYWLTLNDDTQHNKSDASIDGTFKFLSGSANSKVYGLVLKQLVTVSDNNITIARNLFSSANLKIDIDKPNIVYIRQNVFYNCQVENATNSSPNLVVQNNIFRYSKIILGQDAEALVANNSFYTAAQDGVAISTYNSNIYNNILVHYHVGHGHVSMGNNNTVEYNVLTMSNNGTYSETNTNGVGWSSE